MEENKKIKIKRSYIVIFCLVVVVFFGIVSGGDKSTEPVVKQTTKPLEIAEESKTKGIVEELGAEEESEVETKISRDEIIEIFKANALANWGDDYRMVRYEIEQQTEAYDWVAKQTEYPDIMARAKQNWDNDYSMVRYEYKQQVEAYESL